MQSDRLEMLLRAEREVVPDEGAADRIWAGVEHRLAHGPAPPSGADVAPGALGGAAGGGGVALKVLAGVAVLAAAIGVWAARAGDEPAPAPVVVAAAPMEAVPEDRREVPPPPPPVVVAPAAVVAEVAPEPAPEEPPVEASKKRPRAKARVDVAEPAEAPVDFAAELQLIAEIRAALKQGDSARALARVDEHARRFGARGQLVQERLAYHVEALCAAGRVDDARRVAGDLLTKWPDSTHAPRVKKSCAGA